jgi:hypothetical protein
MKPDFHWRSGMTVHRTVQWNNCFRCSEMTVHPLSREAAQELQPTAQAVGSKVKNIPAPKGPKEQFSRTIFSPQLGVGRR